AGEPPPPVGTTSVRRPAGAAAEAVVLQCGALAQRRANAALRRQTVPPKRSSPLPITPGGHVPLSWRARSPFPGRQRRHARNFPSRTKARIPAPRNDPQTAQVELRNKEKN